MSNFKFTAAAGGEAWRYRVTAPANCPPLVRQLIEHMNDTGLTIGALCERAGIDAETFKSWKRQHSPRLGNFEAACNAAGLDIVLRRKA